MRPGIATLVAPCLLVCAATRSSAQGADSLTAEQRSLIDGGGQLFLTEPLPGSPWPRARAFQYIDATPEEAAAVFADYERQTTYIPGVKKSKIARVVDRGTAEVDYTLAVPVLPDEHYTVRDSVSADGAGGGYRVDWVLLRASSTKATVGNARFVPHRNERTGRDGTLFIYTNFVTPGSRLAGLGFVKARALRQMRETVSAVVRQVEAERRADPALLQRQVAELRAAVGR